MKTYFQKYLILIFAALLLVSASACTTGYGRPGYGPGYGSGSQQRAQELGYQRGYEHGRYDRQRGSYPNYEDDSRFRYGISQDRYINDIFRRAYVEGYRYGYYGRRY